MTSNLPDRRWLVLAAVSVAQLMIVLDATITSIALPSAQADLGFASSQRQWIVTAYALAFGSLLLLGGRLGDVFGRKRTFVAGLLGFGVASALGGAASSFGMLVAARAAQGVFAALLAPSALALLTTTFTDPRERGKAFGVFSAVASAGSGIGILLGGVLTEWLSWRWCLYVTLVIALPVAAASVRLLVNRIPVQHTPLDIPGTATATAGLFALVYGLASSASAGWGDPRTVVSLAAAAILLAAFVLLELRVAHPLLPLHVVADRTRGGAFLAVAIAGSAIFAVFLFLTFYLQVTKDYVPIRTGVAFLPLPLTIFVLAPRVNAVLLPNVGPRRLMVFGMLAGTAAMAWFTRLAPDSAYVTAVLPGLVLLGVAMASIMAPAFATATAGVAPADAGVASALVNTMQQIGGSVGTALLSSVFASAVAGALDGDARTPAARDAAAVHGYSVAFWVAAGLFALGAVVLALLMRPHAAGAAPGRQRPVPPVRRDDMAPASTQLDSV